MGSESTTLDDPNDCSGLGNQSPVFMDTQELLNRYRQGERDFAHVDLSGANLSGSNLRQIDLTGADLTGANLTWVAFNEAKLTGACLRRADMGNAMLTNSQLSGANLSGANLTKADLRLTLLQEAELNWAMLTEADLTSADLQHSTLDQINLERAKLTSVNLVGAELMEANLRQANLTGANLTGANLRESHLEDANLRNAILANANLTEANLLNACLRSANLTGADLHRTMLAGTDLSDAILDRADLSRADLEGAYLLKTSFKQAHLLRTNLQKVYLLQGDLSHANLRGSDLRQADLSGSYLSDANLGETDMTGALFLESRLIRTILDGAKLTGACVQNWKIEGVDFSKVECRYLWRQFNFTTKSPASRYPAERDFEPGEMGREYEENSTTIEVWFTEAPNWEVLVLTLAELQQENRELHLNVESYVPMDHGYLLRLLASHMVNGKIIAEQILNLYPEVKERLSLCRHQLLSVLKQPPLSRSPSRSETGGNTSGSGVPAQPTIDRQQQLYQETSKQIKTILFSQMPEQFVDNIQRLLNYLKEEGINLEELQKKVIVTAIVQRGQQDDAFRENLFQWEKKASQQMRVSMMGKSVRVAIAILWKKQQQEAASN